MRILMCHKFFHMGTSTGYMFDLSKVMMRHGHEVVHFAIKDPRNEPSPYASYFADNIDFNQPTSLGGYVRYLGHALYSVNAQRKVEALIQTTRLDVVFLHAIYTHLSPSILLAFRRHGLPVVMHVQDYFLICPNYTLLSHGQICERCRGHKYYNAVIQRCCKDSIARSLAMATITYAHKAVRIYERNIDRFICPSQFLRRKMIEFGQEAGPLVHIPQAVSLECRKPCYESDNYILFVGWLKKEKGVATLIRSMKPLRGTQLLIVGHGPEEGALKTLAENEHLENVVFAGRQVGQALQDIVRRARLVVVPSEWYEVYGMVTYEAFTLGKPVVGSHIGATPELVEDGVTGLLFEPGNPDDLAAKIRYLLDRPQLVREMGRNGRRLVEGPLSAEQNYNSIMALYSQIMDSMSQGT